MSTTVKTLKINFSETLREQFWAMGSEALTMAILRPQTRKVHDWTNISGPNSDELEN